MCLIVSTKKREDIQKIYNLGAIHDFLERDLIRQSLQAFEKKFNSGMSYEVIEDWLFFINNKDIAHGIV
jgi:hypothetical protein